MQQKLLSLFLGQVVVGLLGEQWPAQLGPCTSRQGLLLPSAVVQPGLQLQGAADGGFVDCVPGWVFMGFVAGELGG